MRSRQRRRAKRTGPHRHPGPPAFTADGRHIVFGANDGIAIMRTDGTGRRQLTQTPFPGVGYDDDPNVSPDGKLVTFVRVKTPEVEQALFSMHLDGSHLRQLTPYDLEVAIKHDRAPDGSRIAIIIHADAPEPGQSANLATRSVPMGRVCGCSPTSGAARSTP